MPIDFKAVRDGHASYSAVKSGAGTGGRAWAAAVQTATPPLASRVADSISTMVRELPLRLSPAPLTHRAMQAGIRPSLDAIFKAIGDHPDEQRKTVDVILRETKTSRDYDKVNVGRVIVGAYLASFATPEEKTREVNRLLECDWTDPATGTRDTQIDRAIAAEAFATGVKFDPSRQHGDPTFAAADVVGGIEDAWAEGTRDVAGQVEILRPLFRAGTRNLPQDDLQKVLAGFQKAQDDHFNDLEASGRKPADLADRRQLCAKVIETLIGELQQTAAPPMRPE